MNPTPPVNIDDWIDRDVSYDEDTKTLVIRQFTIADLERTLQVNVVNPVAGNELYSNWTSLFIYADTIELNVPDGGYALDVTDKESVVIVARSMTISSEHDGTFSITARPGSGPVTLKIRVQSLDGEIQVLCGQKHFKEGIGSYQSDTPIKVPDTPSANGPFEHGVDETVTMSEPVQTAGFFDIGDAPPDWKIGSPFYWLMLQTFQRAVDAAGTPQKAVPMFEWVQRNTVCPAWPEDRAGEMRAIGAQAAALAARLQRPPGVRYVPKLSMSVYKQLCQSSASAAEKVDKHYRSFSQKAKIDDASIKAAQLMLGSVDTQISIADYKLTGRWPTDAPSDLQTTRAVPQPGYQQQLKILDHTLRQNLVKFFGQASGMHGIGDAYRKATERYASPIREQMGVPSTGDGPQGPVVNAGDKLKEAFDDAKKETQGEAVGKLIGAVASLAAALVDPAAAVSSLAADASMFTRVMTSISAVCKELANLSSLMEIGEQLSSLSKSIAAPNSSALNISSTASETNLSDTDWQMLRDSWDNNVNKDNLPSRGTDKVWHDVVTRMGDYQTEGNILFLYGQALTDTYAAIAKLQIQIAQTECEKTAYVAQKKSINNYISDESNDEHGFQKAQLLLRQQYLAAKRQFIMNYEDFQDAYFYWLLKAPSQLSTLLGSDIGTLSNQLDQQVADGLSGLGTTPTTVQCDYYFRPSGSDRSRLNNGRSVQVPLSPDPASWSNGYDRLRVEAVEIYFEGLSNDSRTYDIYVTNDGAYHTWFNGILYSFMAVDPMIGSFSANVNAGPQAFAGTNSITTDTEALGENDLSFGQDSTSFALPSLFTTWSLQADPKNADNRSIDWTKVTKVLMRFTCAAVPRPPDEHHKLPSSTTSPHERTSK